MVAFQRIVDAEASDIAEWEGKRDAGVRLPGGFFGIGGELHCDLAGHAWVGVLLGDLHEGCVWR